MTICKDCKTETTLDYLAPDGETCLDCMTEEQWATVIDAVNDKYPDSDCLDILINNVRYFPSFLFGGQIND